MPKINAELWHKPLGTGKEQLSAVTGLPEVDVWEASGRKRQGKRITSLGPLDREKRQHFIAPTLKNWVKRPPCEWHPNSTYSDVPDSFWKNRHIDTKVLYLKQNIGCPLMSHFKVCFFMLYHRKATTWFPPLGRVASYLEFRDKALTGILNTTHALCGELVPCQSSSSSSAQDKDNLKISFYQMVGERFHCHLLSHFSWTEGGHMEVIANAFPNSRPWVKHPRPVIPARMFHCLRKTSVRVKLVDSSWLRALGSSILSAITVSTKYNLQSSTKSVHEGEQFGCFCLL